MSGTEMPLSEKIVRTWIFGIVIPNLSQLGRRQEIYYGEIIRTLQIPVGYPVIASPFCRAVESSQLAFDWANVQIDPFGVEYRIWV